ncbi:hypothetical protein LLE66_05055 [Xanthomonas campestris pv. campestris]|nr:hypothetical protein [Xanthomonas campestris pv. campestris]
MCIRACDGLNTCGEFDNAFLLGGGSRIGEVGIAKRHRRHRDPRKQDVGGHQQIRGGGLLHDQLGLGIAAQQRAVFQVQPKAANLIGCPARVADSDVDGGGRRGAARDAGERQVLAWDCLQVFRCSECRRRKTDAGHLDGVGAVLLGVDQRRATGGGEDEL